MNCSSGNIDPGSYGSLVTPVDGGSVNSRRVIYKGTHRMSYNDLPLCSFTLVFPLVHDPSRHSSYEEIDIWENMVHKYNNIVKKIFVLYKILR